MKDFLSRLGRSLTGHLLLKILSIILALIFWAYIISVTPSLTRTKHVTDLSVSVSGDSTIAVYGLALATDVYTEYQNSISAYVDVSQSQFSRVTNKNVVVTVDVSHIRSAGRHDVQLNAVSVYGEVTRIIPDTITVEVESLDSREMPVEINLAGMNTDSYWYNIQTETVNPQQITLSGPVSVIQNVSSVGATLDVTNADSTFRRGVMLNLYDNAHQPISSRLISKSASTCSMMVEIYPKAEYDVYVDASQINVKEGYQIDNISLQPPSIVVAAEKELLETLDHLPLEIPSDMQAAGQSFTTRLSFSGLSEFRYVSAGQVYMTVTISEIQDSVTLTGIPIPVFGLDADEYSVTFSPASFSVQLTGPRSVVSGVTTDDLVAFVDASGLGEGVYELPITIGNRSDFSYVSVMPATVRAEITPTGANAEEADDAE